MNYYLSVDGGGTKTDFLLTDRAGRPVARRRLGGCTYSYIGQDGVCELLEEGARLLLRDAAAGEDAVACAVWGIPCYGEDRAFDGDASRRLPRASCPARTGSATTSSWGSPVRCCLGPGVHVVAGTGAIAMGREPGGKTARARTAGNEPFFGRRLRLLARAAGAGALRAAGGPPQGNEGRSTSCSGPSGGWNRTTRRIRYYRENLENRRERIAAVQEVGSAAPPRPGTGTPRGSTNRRRGPSRRTAGGAPRQLDFPEGEPAARLLLRRRLPGGSADPRAVRAAARRNGRGPHAAGAAAAVRGVLLAAQADPGPTDPAEIAETLKSFEEMERK